MARLRARASEWAERVGAWRASGDTAEVFAEQHGWNARTLRWWESHLRRSQSVGVPQAGFVRLIERRDGATPVVVSPALEVVLGRGRAIRVAPGADLELLRAVVDALDAD